MWAMSAISRSLFICILARGRAGQARVGTTLASLLARPRQPDAATPRRHRRSKAACSTTSSTSCRHKVLRPVNAILSIFGSPSMRAHVFYVHPTWQGYPPQKPWDRSTGVARCKPGVARGWAGFDPVDQRGPGPTTASEGWGFIGQSVGRDPATQTTLPGDAAFKQLLWDCWSPAEIGRHGGSGPHSLLISPHSSALSPELAEFGLLMFLLRGTGNAEVPAKEDLPAGQQGD